jgi:hypothetical protein
MTYILQSFHLLVIALAGWLYRHQQAVIEYLIEENRVLNDQLEGRRLRFTDEQRMRLAAKAKVLVRQLLKEIDTIVTPDTTCLASQAHRQEVDLCQEGARPSLYQARDRRFGVTHGKGEYLLG